MFYAGRPQAAPFYYREDEMYRIYIVEDDEKIAAVIQKQIRSWGWEAEIAADFSDIMEEFRRFAPHLVLMDISLPFFNGYYWCGEIRRESQVPIMFLSSASDNMNIVMAMNMGGDDFIAKPFDLEVLTAKIRALFRRSYDFADRVSVIEHRGAVLDTDAAAILYEGKRGELSKNEYRILCYLMENRGKVVKRETLMEKLWETDSYVDENTLTVNVARLRRKLERLGLEDFITTKKGIGYIIEI